MSNNNFSAIDSLGMFECYDVWTHQSWITNQGASGSCQEEGVEMKEIKSDGNENVIDNDEIEFQADQISITSTDSYKENVLNFFNKLKDVAFGSSSSTSKNHGKYQAVPCQIEKF